MALISIAGNAKEPILRTRVAGDTFDRYILNADGTREYGTGSAASALLTDSSGGTASNTIAATAGIYKLIHPLTSLATGLSTAAIDIMTTMTLGHAFKLLDLSFVTTVAGTGASASQVFNLEIGTTNVTGGVLTLLLADTDTIGKIKAATAITALNTGTASDTISIEMAASGTVFTAGAGYFVITVQNMDTVNALASIARRV